MKLLTSILLVVAPSVLLARPAVAAPRKRAHAPTQLRYVTLDRMIRQFSREAAAQGVVAFAKD
jgi:hypothetical protein